MTLRGSCLCGAVAFTVDGPLGEIDACHGTKCRKSSGHYLVSTDDKGDYYDLPDDGTPKSRISPREG